MEPVKDANRTDTLPRRRRARRGTYSIVVHDERTGAMGVPVPSHWFSVGSLVTWAQAGGDVRGRQSAAIPVASASALAAAAVGQRLALE